MANAAPVRVTVSGASGNVSYSLLFRIAAGDLLGRDVPVELRLLDIEPAMKALEGVAMELDDSAVPLLKNIVMTTDAKEAFDGTSWALLVGSVPRREGMERGDLLKINGGIFGPYGKALAANAASDVRILVVGNPCNTNCLIARSNGKDIPDDRWFAMVRLDQNPRDLDLRSKLQYGMFMSLAGSASGVAVNVSHAIGHVLGAHASVPHGETTGTVLPAVLRWNRESTQAAQSEIAGALGARDGDAAAAVLALVMKLGLPSRLRDVGVRQEDLGVLAQKTMHESLLRNSRRPVKGPADIVEILETAW